MLDRSEAVDGVFKALASPVRREILFHLRSGELAAGDIAARFDIAAPTISRHLGVLRAARLVSERRDGNRILYSAEPERMPSVLTAFMQAVRVVTRSRRGSTRRGGGR